jgi:hypothetical protein
MKLIYINKTFHGAIYNPPQVLGTWGRPLDLFNNWVKMYFVLPFYNANLESRIESLERENAELRRKIK